MEEVKKRILEQKIIAIIRGVDKEHLIDTAVALRKGGIECLEISINHSTAQEVKKSLEMIRYLCRKMGNEICIGAGTVLTEEEVVLCAEAGARYIISPNMNPGVIAKTKELGLLSVPGVMTPTEAENAYEAGADFIKLFPAGILGPAYIKALKGPLKKLPIFAVGEITLENCRIFMEAGCCGLGIGGNLIDYNEIKKGNYNKITELASKFKMNLA